MASPTWYDLLGIRPDATPEQIKAAWRDATDKFEPGSGGTQFSLFNEAADVLLDPAKRTAYDAEIGLEPAPVVEAPSVVELVEEPEAPEPEAPEPSKTAEPAEMPEPVGTPEPARGRLAKVGNALRSTLALTLLAVLVVASLVLTVVLAGNLKDRAEVADAGSEAMAVAERALPLVIGYDYRHLDADRAKAKAYMTPRYQAIYDKLMDGLIAGTTDQPGGALRAKTVVTATLLSGAVGVVDASAKTVRVLAFLDQSSVNGSKQGPSFANRMVGTFVKRDGRWLLDGIDPLIFSF